MPRPWVAAFWLRIASRRSTVGLVIRPMLLTIQRWPRVDRGSQPFLRQTRSVSWAAALMPHFCSEMTPSMRSSSTFPERASRGEALVPAALTAARNRSWSRAEVRVSPQL